MLNKQIFASIPLIALSSCGKPLINGKKILKDRGYQACLDNRSVLPAQLEIVTDCPGATGTHALQVEPVAAWSSGDWSGSSHGAKAEIHSTESDEPVIRGRAWCGDATTKGQFLIDLSTPRGQMPGWANDVAVSERGYLCRFATNELGVLHTCVPAVRITPTDDWHPLTDAASPTSCSATLNGR